MNILINTALIIIPFYEIFIFCMPEVNSIFSNTRIGKNVAFLYLITIISILGVYRGIINIPNKFFYMLTAFLVINYHFMPKIFIDGIPYPSPWFFESAFLVLISFIYFTSVASSDFNNERIFNIMSWVGFLMACYGIAQYFGLDQFYAVKPKSIIGTTESANIAGNLGQPTLLASFLAMIVPIQFCIRKHSFGIITFIAICLCQAKLAIFASILGTSVYYIYRSDRRLYGFKVFSFFLFIIIAGYLTYSHFKPNNLLSSNGRYQMWREILLDIKDGRVVPNGKDYSLTGHGIGSFKFFNTRKHDGNWAQAHNEYLQVFYEMGFIGLILLILAIIKTFDDSYFVFTNSHYGAVGAFFVTAICAVYYFQWHLPSQALYSLTILGILYKRSGACLK